MSGENKCAGCGDVQSFASPGTVRWVDTWNGKALCRACQQSGDYDECRECGNWGENDEMCYYPDGSCICQNCQ